MSSVLKISAVSYLNTKPFLFGLEHSSILENIELSLDTPALVAQKLLNNEADIGLVPVAVIPKLNHPSIISSFCIGANGTVKTVCLFSNVPIHEIKTVYLDNQSRTSVLLVQLLFKEYWKKEVSFLPAFDGYEKAIRGDTAAVIIGDRAIVALGMHVYEYDLAEAWKQYTGLPFVFAAWVSNKPVHEDFIIEFDAALRLGLYAREELANEYNQYNTPSFSVKEYWNTNIQYHLDDDKKKALSVFLQKLNYGLNYTYH